MKKILTTTVLLGSVIAVSACSSIYGVSEKDETLAQPPYAEERTVGITEAVMPEPVKSAEPVFESRQVK